MQSTSATVSLLADSLIYKVMTMWCQGSKL